MSKEWNLRKAKKNQKKNWSSNSRLSKQRIHKTVPSKLPMARPTTKKKTVMSLSLRNQMKSSPTISTVAMDFTQTVDTRSILMLTDLRTLTKSTAWKLRTGLMKTRDVFRFCGTSSQHGVRRTIRFKRLLKFQMLGLQKHTSSMCRTSSSMKTRKPIMKAD